MVKYTLYSAEDRKARGRGGSISASNGRERGGKVIRTTGHRESVSPCSDSMSSDERYQRGMRSRRGGQHHHDNNARNSRRTGRDDRRGDIDRRSDRTKGVWKHDKYDDNDRDTRSRRDQYSTRDRDSQRHSERSSRQTSGRQYSDSNNN